MHKFLLMQVALYNHFEKNMPIKEHLCKCEKNLLKISIDGMEIFVELAGDEMKSHLFIDILVRSSKTKLHTLQFIDDHVLSQVEQLCSAPQVGCQGVALVRGILRPKVVQLLLLCKDRKEQVVLVEDLKQDLLAANLDTSYVHTWKKVANVGESNVNFFGGHMKDTAISLLGEVDTREVFQRRQRAPPKFENQVTKLEKNKTYFEVYPKDFQNEIKMDSFHTNDVQQHIDLESNGDVTLQHLAKSINNAIVPTTILQSMDKRLENMEKLMEGTNEGIQSMASYLLNMSMELDNKINLSVQLQERLVPCNVYFTTTGSGCQRNLIMKMLPGTQIVHLHLFCESIEGIHVVENQKGEKITLIDPKVRKWVPYLTTGLTIFSLLLKVGAHVAAGVGDMIPDFGKALLLTVDTEALQDFLPSDGIHKMLEHESFQGNKTLIEQKSIVNMADEKNSAEQWLVNFLKERNNNILESFDLTRVKYRRMNGKGPLIRWVCQKCRNYGVENQMLEDCPVAF
jgi:hypothetical protein